MGMICAEVDGGDVAAVIRAESYLRAAADR
jgi:hypothetical protein